MIGVLEFLKLTYCGILNYTSPAIKASLPAPKDVVIRMSTSGLWGPDLGGYPCLLIYLYFRREYDVSSSMHNK